MFECTFIPHIFMHTCVHRYICAITHLFHIIYIGVRVALSQSRSNLRDHGMGFGDACELVREHMKFEALGLQRPHSVERKRQSFRLSSRDQKMNVTGGVDLEVWKAVFLVIPVGLGMPGVYDPWIWPCSPVKNCRFSEGTVHYEILPRSFQ